jgi:hypothetical protein
LQAKSGECDLPILRACHESFDFFVSAYFLSEDPFRRKSMALLANIVAVWKGRPAAMAVLTFALKNVQTDDDLATLLQFIRDTELWIPGLKLFFILK